MSNHVKDYNAIIVQEADKNLLKYLPQLMVKIVNLKDY